jgi:hypothetical protein
VYFYIDLHGLLINVKKPKEMHIYNSYMRNNEVITVKIHTNECLHNFRQNCKCENIEQIKTHLYLGVIIEQDFKWNNHNIYKVLGKINPSNTCYIKKIVSKKTLRNIYFSLVHILI